MIGLIIIQLNLPKVTTQNVKIYGSLTGGGCPWQMNHSDFLLRTHLLPVRDFIACNFQDTICVDPCCYSLYTLSSVVHGLNIENKPCINKSDQHEISPHNINALENMVVVRIEYMIREDESIWYFTKFSPIPLLNCIGTVNENLNFDIRV